MGSWGWRALAVMLCVSVWLTGCADDPSRAAPATLPHLTQPTLVVRQRMTLPPSPTPGLAILPHVSPAITPASPLDDAAALVNQALTPPSCYETPHDGILCIGYIENTFSNPLSEVMLQIQLYDADGLMLRDVEMLVEQQLILPGESAPYSALFINEGDQRLLNHFAGVVTTVDHVDIADPPDPFQVLVVESLRGEMSDGLYIVQGDVVNPYPETAEAVRVVGTAYDHAGRVTGYRVLTLDSMAAGERMTVRLEIFPQSQPLDGDFLRLTMHVEARRASQQ